MSNDIPEVTGINTGQCLVDLISHDHFPTSRHSKLHELLVGTYKYAIVTTKCNFCSFNIQSTHPFQQPNESLVALLYESFQDQMWRWYGHSIRIKITVYGMLVMTSVIQLSAYQHHSLYTVWCHAFTGQSDKSLHNLDFKIQDTRGVEPTFMVMAFEDSTPLIPKSYNDPVPNFFPWAAI
jgi:hypothetical protein